MSLTSDIVCDSVSKALRVYDRMYITAQPTKMLSTSGYDGAWPNMIMMNCLESVGKRASKSEEIDPLNLHREPHTPGELGECLINELKRF